MDKPIPLERMVLFSDAVFAIALTVLALDLKLPVGIPPERLNAELIDGIPELLAFVLSFVVIARVWMSHHADFYLIRDFNTKLAWMNMLLLFFVAVLPAPTAMLSDYGGNSSPWPSVLYAATISCVYLTLSGMWMYAWRNGLMDDSVDAHQHWRVFLARMTPTSVFLLSIPAAFVFGSNTPFLWLLLLPASLLSRWLSQRRGSQEVTSPAVG